MCEDMTKRVESFVLRFRPARKGPLETDTRLLQDLGMDGDDAVEFIEAFSEEFNVDMSEFEFKRHFGSEGFNPISYLYCLLFKRERLRFTPITLRDLVAAARAKKWQYRELGQKR